MAANLLLAFDDIEVHHQSTRVVFGKGWAGQYKYRTCGDQGFHTSSLGFYMEAKDHAGCQLSTFAAQRLLAKTEGGLKIVMRKAVPADADLLRAWDQLPHVRSATSDAPDEPPEDDWDTELAPRDDGTDFFIAMAGAEPAGMMQIIDPARERTAYWGPIAPNLRAIDIWIGPKQFLNRGYGTQMMTWALNHCFRDPAVVAVVIDPLASNTASHRFYERFGFRFAERRRFDATSDCFVFRLDRQDWQS